jgi:hypothetical protein
VKRRPALFSDEELEEELEQEMVGEKMRALLPRFISLVSDSSEVTCASMAVEELQRLLLSGVRATPNTVALRPNVPRLHETGLVPSRVQRGLDKDGVNPNPLGTGTSTRTFVAIPEPELLTIIWKTWG